LLFYNGFQIRSCYGSWQQEPLTATSPAMIYVCQRRAWLGFLVLSSRCLTKLFKCRLANAVSGFRIPPPDPATRA
jgi:hypothetical protein